MADLIYTSNVSLDGFIEDHQGSFDFTAPDDDVFAFITGLGHLTVGGANLARQTSARRPINGRAWICIVSTNTPSPGRP